MKYILYLLLLSVSASAQNVCDLESVSVIDTVYFEGNKWGSNGMHYCQSNVVFPEWGLPEHKWVYQATKTPFSERPENRVFVYFTPPECPDETVEDYERICERCLRHERRKEVQHYQKVKKEESKFEQLKSRVAKSERKD